MSNFQLWRILWWNYMIFLSITIGQHITLRNHSGINSHAVSCLGDWLHSKYNPDQSLFSTSIEFTGHLGGMTRNCQSWAPGGGCLLTQALHPLPWALAPGITRIQILVSFPTSRNVEHSLKLFTASKSHCSRLFQTNNSVSIILNHWIQHMCTYVHDI